MRGKYLFDKVVSFFGLVCLSPVFLIVAILIKKRMPGGPVIFKQQRVGQYGRLFTVFKFRSMNVAGEGRTSIASEEEDRITPLGKTLRRYKLDELPELWNVLKGDMSFVGPRPDVPGYADKLKGKDRDILKLKPGITGPASLKYRQEEDLLNSVTNPQEYNDKVIYPDKVRLNLYYLEHYSFFKDIEMIMCTVLGKKMRYAGEEI
ncbi:MAG: sugar transferase [Bacteroidales bacterium]|nr:sugar transferase [Bacteroidales bacterium]MCI7653156.1 sugar transferase [Bacteroidales bacterium]MDD7704762.1 sugar transferase [Bacteroidales bacterium]MDY5321107.1 sugar transferase [Prevotella sp.]